MRYTEQRTPNMTGNTAGYRHDERYGRAVSHKPRQSPSTGKKSSPSFALPAPSRGVQRRSLPVRNACGELMRGRRNPTDSWLLRDIVSMYSLDILSSHALDMWLSAFVAVMFTRR